MREITLNDLNLRHDHLSIVCYHQTGVRLMDEFSVTDIFLGKLNMSEVRAVFYERLKPFKLIIKNITLRDDKYAYDTPLTLIREFVANHIDFSINPQAQGLSNLRKISPPLYNHITQPETQQSCKTITQ